MKNRVLSQVLSISTRPSWPVLRRPDSFTIAVTSFILVALAFDYVTLLRSPPIYIDEAWNASRALGLVQTGWPYGPLDAGVFERFQGYLSYFPLLGTWVQSIAIRLFGLNLFAIRITSFVFGAAFLAATYGVGRAIEGHRLGLVGAALATTSNPFLVASHLGRHDIIVAAMGYTALAFYLSDRAPRPSASSVLSGLLVSLTLDIHPNGAIFGLVIAFLYVLDNPLTFWKLGRFWGFVAGGCAGLAWFAAVHLYPDPAVYASLVARVASYHAPPLLLFGFTAFPAAFAWIGLTYFLANDFRIPLVAAAAVIGLLRGTKAERRILLILVLTLVGFAATIRIVEPVYLILLDPAGELLLAALVIRCANAGWVGSPARSARSVVVGTLLLSALVRTVATAATDWQPSYQIVADRLARDVGSTTSLMGPPNLWFAFADRKYVSTVQFGYFLAYVPGSTLDDALTALHPDIVIVSAQVGGPNIVSVAIPDSRFLRSLEGRGTLVDTFWSSSGYIYVYRINWR